LQEFYVTWEEGDDFCIAELFVSATRDVSPISGRLFQRYDATIRCV